MCLCSWGTLGILCLHTGCVLLPLFLQRRELQMPAASSQPSWVGPNVNQSYQKFEVCARCSNVGYTWKAREFMGDAGKHQGLPICGSEHALFLLRKHLGALEACPLNYSPPSCWFSGIGRPPWEWMFGESALEQASSRRGCNYSWSKWAIFELDTPVVSWPGFSWKQRLRQHLLGR